MEYLELLRSEFTTLLSTVWFEVFWWGITGIEIGSSSFQIRILLGNYQPRINTDPENTGFTSILTQPEFEIIGFEFLITSFTSQSFTLNE